MLWINNSKLLIYCYLRKYICKCKYTTIWAVISDRQTIRRMERQPEIYIIYIDNLHIPFWIKHLLRNSSVSEIKKNSIIFLLLSVLRWGYTFSCVILERLFNALKKLIHTQPKWYMWLLHFSFNVIYRMISWQIVKQNSQSLTLLVKLKKEMS